MKKLSMFVAIVIPLLLAGCAHFDVPWNDTWEKGTPKQRKEQEEFEARIAAAKVVYEAGEKAREEERRAAVEAYLGRTPTASPQVAEALRSGSTIVRGMTEQEFLFVMPKPNKVNASVGSWGRHEQWVYYSSYYYFDNGKLTSWQTEGTATR